MALLIKSKINPVVGVYLITSPVGKKYIGSSINIKQRFAQYRNLGCKKQQKLFASLNKYGVNNHCFEILYQCTQEELYKWERFFGEQFDVINSGLNFALPSFKDAPAIVSKETRLKQSKARKGLKISEISKIKMSESKKGKKHSDATKRKMGDIRRGKKFKKNKDVYGSIVINTKTGKTFKSITECAKHLGVLRTTLDNHLRNKYLNNKFSDFKIIKFFNNGSIN